MCNQIKQNKEKMKNKQQQQKRTPPPPKKTLFSPRFLFRPWHFTAATETLSQECGASKTSAARFLSVGNSGNERQLGLGYGLALKHVTHFKIKYHWNARLVQDELQMVGKMSHQGKGTFLRA